MDLFDYMRQEAKKKESPLAARLRPTTLDEVVGQQQKVDKLEKNNVYPKTYSIVLTDKEDNTKSIKITGLTSEIIKSENFNIIISDIINDNKESEILDENNIKYEHLN